MLFPPKEKTIKRNENERKRQKWSRQQRNSQPTARGRLTYCHCIDLQLGNSKDDSPIAFVCNVIVARLDYSQGSLELKRKEQFMATNWD
ncbi:hypothetical protein M9H77_06784 [Catharanthus roseus]|uniref:Uncharacterized protein n=1 Tax=Catharanthus roseus TaxID=4058 RepID=A0ACC0BT95_CATRO|nr:hypothetical protein M9H77_06784 [Catharanthus roseus]